ncbi:tetratricopeptide repeat-containing sensor histidine kinase [Flavobacterium eburneipallidum]|uniref:tetratricopeptide repeat-containing sensor histidine kinase n=1 Tax=Flavobacterium eburneipallidum TaxID=3003263 RepID=UPI00248234C7|nr:tetratricopeptide repeat-containing sensor histidine kinase [Flavobacterium eburneipallidum]
MIQKSSLLYFSILFLFPFFLFSQITSNIDIISKRLQKKAIEYQPEANFVKSQYSFLKKDWDSTLIYTTKQLSTNTNREIADYCHFFRARIFYNKGLYKEAKKELLLVSKAFEFSTFTTISLGNTFLELRDFKTAIVYYKTALQSPDIKNQPYSFAKIHEGLGTCYLFLEEYDKAEEYLLTNLHSNKNDQVHLYSAYNTLANLYYVQDKNAKALYYFEKAYLLSKEIKDVDVKERASANLAVFEENRGNFKQALIYRKDAEQWNDSLNNQNKIWAVADFEKKFAVAQKQKQIKVLEVENQLKNTQRNWLFFSAMVLLTLLTAGIYLYAQKVKNAKTILLQKNKLDELNATKDQLFSIVSHDLRSSVNALKTSNSKLSATLETKNYEDLNQLIIQNSGIANGAYSLLDNLLHWAMLQTKQLYFHKESVHLHSIVQQIEYNYKPLLLDKSISFENSVAKNCFIFVDLDSLKIVLRNLLDNAIKFSNENGKISFYTTESNTEFCQLVLEDNGIGMNQNTIDELLQDNELLAKKSNSEIIGTGLGMQLCKQMIKKNGGTINIESQPNKGTKMILLLPKTAQNG